MTAFSPLDAATAGLRVMRRQPKALAGWIGVWVLALVVVGVLQVITTTSAAPGVPPLRGLPTLAARFGPLWPILVPVILVLWIMNTATLFRAVLRPADHGWRLFKLGADEARLGVLTVAGSLLLVAFGSGPALILFVLVKPVLAMVPASEKLVVALGTIATVCLELWLAVRLSLAPVHTFAEGRFHLVGYWRLTRGRYWRLLFSYILVFLEIGIVLLAIGLVLLLSGWAAGALGAPHGLDLPRRLLLLGLVGVAAILGAVLFVIPLTLVCACQALAYAAIIKPDPTSPWGPIGGGRSRRDPGAPIQ